MPDPFEPSRDAPEEAGQERPASPWLRRRVLARVRAEPEPIGARALGALRRRLTRRRRRRRTLAVLGAGSALAILVGVLLAGGRSGTLGRARVAPSLSGAEASLHRAGGHAELRLSDMPQPPVGEIYEVWLTSSGSAPRPTNALFNVTSSGKAAVEVPGSLRGVRRVTVTAEPRGGSDRPTGPVVLAVALRRTN
jgi:anti-sigma-K factor RskA